MNFKIVKDWSELNFEEYYAIMNDDSKVYWLIEKNIKVGIVELSVTTKKRLYIDNILIFNEYKGNGYGTKVINMLKKSNKEINGLAVEESFDFWRKQGAFIGSIDYERGVANLTIETD